MVEKIMRDIKFEYVLNIKGKITRNVLSLEHIESGDINYDGIPLKRLALTKGLIVARRQYTGLKDKNGVEIYEGDIVKIQGYIYEVIFERGCFMLYGIPHNDINGEKLIIVRFIDSMEVIGNIYENPELLEKTL